MLRINFMFISTTLLLLGQTKIIELKEIYLKKKSPFSIGFMNIFWAFSLFVIILKTGCIFYRRNIIRPALRPKKGEGILFGIIIGLGIGIYVSIIFTHFVFLIIGIAFGHYIGLILEALACPTSSKEIISYRKYSLAGTIVAIGSLLYAALAIE